MSLNIPLVACQSHGGEYDDTSFMAGVEVGQINCLLGLGFVTVMTQTVHTSLLSQLDLIAMAHGFIIELVSGEGSPEVVVVFSRTE